MKDNKKSHKLKTPLNDLDIRGLKSGEMVYLSGTIYGARDAAHKRMVKAIEEGTPLPIELKDIILFYVGPSPTPPGKKSGSIGPTTSVRMDRFTEPLLERGVRAMIGKGARSTGLKKMLPKYRAVYFVSIGGIASYLSSTVEGIEVIAYDDLGAEAIHRIEVKDFPLFVAYDIYGGDIFEEALLSE